MIVQYFPEVVVKKLIISVIFLLIAGGLAFYFGLLSRKVPDDSIGIVFTKTGGWNKKPVYPGKIYWHPGALLPTNVTLYTVADKTYTRTVEASGELPNSGAYKEYLDQNADFSWKITASMTVKYDADDLPGLFSETGLRGSGTDGRINEMFSDLNGMLNSIYSELFADQQGIINRPGIDEIAALIRKTAVSRYPFIVITGLSVTEASFPDFELYNRTRDHYLAILKNQTDKLITDINISAEEKSEQTIKMEILKRYGELFAKYPVLIDFLAIDSPNVNKLLPDAWD